MTVAALYVRRDSPYKALPDVECYDVDRDARSYAGPWPVVAHPPCRAWGRLRHMAKPRVDERDLACPVGSSRANSFLNLRAGDNLDQNTLLVTPPNEGPENVYRPQINRLGQTRAEVG